MMERLPALVNADPVLLRRGRFVTLTFLVEMGADAYLVTVKEGRVDTVRPGPFVMPSWTFALRAPKEEWAAFFQPLPPPGANDLFALLKRRVLKAEGDLHPFMANLFYFKGLFAALRGTEAAR